VLGEDARLVHEGARQWLQSKFIMSSYPLPPQIFEGEKRLLNEIKQMVDAIQQPVRPLEREC
jgi:hypothetical protein